ncbi:MAG: outer membrane protein transport protein [bacterium]
MLKKWLSILVVMSIFCLSYVKEGWTAAFEGPGVCVRPLTMGGAFIGLADDWSAVIWNPAGLTQLEGKGFGFSLDYVPAEASDSNSIANPLQPNKDQKDVFVNPGNEIDRFNKQDVKSTVYLPTIAGYTQFRGFVVGGAIYTPLGYASTWEDTVGTISGKYEIEAYEIVFNISAAKKEIMPNLSAGLGLNLVWGKLEKSAQKVTPGYTYKIDYDGDGSDFEGVFSLFYKYQPNLNLGFIYRTGSKITFDGSAKRTHTAIPFLNHSTDYEQVFRHPSTYGFGIAYQPNPKLTLTGDWNRTDWSKQRDEITYTTQQIEPFVNTNEDLDWKDVDKIRLGAEYTLNELWKLRAGFFTDPSPMPDKAVSMTNLIDIDRNYYSLGAGYKKDNWQIDMGILHTKDDQVKKHPATNEEVTYEKKCTSVHIATSCQL